MRAWDYQTCDEQYKGVPLHSIDQSISPEDIKVGQTDQMSRADLSSDVDDVVLNGKVFQAPEKMTGVSYPA